MEHFANVIEQIADKLGIATAYLWPEIVRYYYFRAIVDLFTEVVVFVVFALFLWLTSKLLEKLNDNGDEGVFAFVAAFSSIAGIVLTVIVIVALFSIPNTVATIIEPEGATIVKLLEKK